MAQAGKHIVDAYSELLGGLSAEDMRAIVSHLSKTLKKGRPGAEEAFYATFGGFASEQTAEEIVADIRASRRFRNRDFDL
jgi:hypothetical protein